VYPSSQHRGPVVSSRFGGVLIIGSDPLASRVKELVLRPWSTRPDSSSAQHDRAAEPRRITVCCCDGDAEPHRLLARQLTDAGAVVLAGHERPCELCGEALARGSCLWIPESLLELQLVPALGYVSASSTTSELAGARVDATNEVATVAGRHYPLRSADFRLLSYLVEHEGRWFSEIDLLREVFHSRSSLESNVVRVHVFTLRRSLGPAGRCIQSKRGSGYRFVNL